MEQCWRWFGPRDPIPLAHVRQAGATGVVTALHETYAEVWAEDAIAARRAEVEAAGLRWRDVQPRDDTGQVTVFGKGGRTRAVLLPASVWRLLTGLRDDAGPEAVVFRSRSGGGALNASQVHRVVKAAALRAGLPPEVSAHWLRHAHASHSLDRGAPISLVQATLGHASVATTGRYLHARPNDSSARYLGL